MTVRLDDNPQKDMHYISSFYAHCFDMPLVVRNSRCDFQLKVLKCFKWKEARKWCLGNCTLGLKSPHQLSSYQKTREKRQVQSYTNRLKKKIQRKVRLAAEIQKTSSICQQSLSPQCSKLVSPFKRI